MNNNSICHAIRFDNANHGEIIIGIISQFDIDGIEENTQDILLYYHDSALTELIKSACASLPFETQHEIQLIAPQNWNEIWESNFDPVFIDDFCAIYAPFHTIDTGAYTYPIEIMPKMSFGTGHHETTRMMVRQMRAMSFADKRVFDFGTGTAVLAILAEKLGATEVFAIDNMKEAVENSIENSANNNCKKVEVALADTATAAQGTYDIVLANIIRRVILANMLTLASLVRENGELVISGFLRNDREQMKFACQQAGFALIDELTENNWVCQRYKKK